MTLVFAPLDRGTALTPSVFSGGLTRSCPAASTTRTCGFPRCRRISRLRRPFAGTAR